MFDPAGPVLGIDPGVSRCGYGAVVREAGRLRAVAAGVIRTSPSAPLPERLLVLDRELGSLIAQIAPSTVAVERVLFQANVRTAMSVGQASGVALVIAARERVPVVQYSPNEVKLAVTGHGGADKAQVSAMVARLLTLSHIPGPPDAADALALAICHAGAGRVRAAVDRSSDHRERGGGPVRGYERAVAAALAREAAR